MNNRFTFPIPPIAVRRFSYMGHHPIYALPAIIGDEACACGPLGAIRADRGDWHPDEFMPASAAFAERFLLLPWPPATPMPVSVPFDDHRAAIYRYRPESRIAIGAAVFTAAALELAAALPRAFMRPPTTHTGHLFFQFHGGRGIIFNRRLDRPQGRLQVEERTHYDGTPQSTAPRPSFSFPGWPPQDCTE